MLWNEMQLSALSLMLINQTVQCKQNYQKPARQPDPPSGGVNKTPHWYSIWYSDLNRSKFYFNLFDNDCNQQCTLKKQYHTKTACSTTGPTAHHNLQKNWKTSRTHVAHNPALKKMAKKMDTQNPMKAITATRTK